MDLNTKINLIKRGTEKILTEEDLKIYLENRYSIKPHIPKMKKELEELIKIG